MPRHWELDGAGGSVPPCTPSLGDSQLMLTTRVDTTDVTREIPTSTTDEISFAWTTDTGDPGGGDWGAGDYSGSVNIATLDSDGSFKIQLLRRTSACGTGEILGTSSSFAVAGIASFTVNLDPAAGATGDLYQLRVLGSNSNAHQTKTLTITIDDPDSSAGGQFVTGQSGEIALYIGGKPSGEMDLFISGKPSGDLDLFIEGHEVTSGDIPLFIQGKPSGEITLFLDATPEVSEDIALFIQGKGIIPNHNTFFNDIQTDTISRIISNASDQHIISNEVAFSGDRNLRGISIDKYNEKIYFVSGVAPLNIVRTNYDGSNLEILFTSGANFSVDLEVDYHNQKLFLSTTTPSTLAKFDLVTSGIDIIHTGIADTAQLFFDFDPFNYKIYIGRKFISKDIIVTDYQGKIESTIVPVAGDDINEVELDLLSGKVLWIDGSSVGNQAVNRVNLDGTGFETIIVSSGGGSVLDPDHLTVNTFEEKIYLSDRFIPYPLRFDLDGSNIEFLGFPPKSLTISQQLSSEPDKTEISLYIGGIPSGNIPLFIGGKDNTSGNITLFIQGKDNTSGTIDLFIQGKPSGQIPLFIEGASSGATPVSAEIDLYIGGIPSGEIPLFISGKPSGEMDLFISGRPSGDTSLFIAGIPSGEISLFIHGKDNITGNIDLFIAGKPSGEISLFIKGQSSGEIDLFIGGKPSGDMALFINGVDSASGDISLFINGVIGVILSSGDTSLFIGGRPSGETDLFIEGFSPTNGEIILFTVGCAPKATPVVRPNLFTIPSTVIDIFEREVDALIRDLGKKIKLIYKPTIIDCPNCIFDLIGRKSANRFQSGGPQPFSDGARCPYCRGTGKTEKENSEIILGLVDWKPRDYQDFGISIQNANAIVGIKTLATDAIKIQRATEAIVDYAISDIMKLRCKKLRDPMITGLKNSRYAVSFWIRI